MSSLKVFPKSRGILYFRKSNEEIIMDVDKNIATGFSTVALHMILNNSIKM